MSLKAGVLIIGSLLWDLEKGRPAWRDARLVRASAQAVTAPIRYGRLSESRDDTYTMVFSRHCKDGHAKLIPCSHDVSSLADLVAEAEHLWKAEQPSAKAGRIATDWGCVALVCNPERKIPDEVIRGWAVRVAREPEYGRVSQTAEEGVLVSGDGLLRIDWPRLVEDGSSAQLDLLLVTANEPTLCGKPLTYPSAETIANAWNAAESSHAEYFWKNAEYGIRTFEDDEIRAQIRPRGQAHG